jgi:hypothetical protein
MANQAVHSSVVGKLLAASKLQVTIAKVFMAIRWLAEWPIQLLAHNICQFPAVTGALEVAKLKVPNESIANNSNKEECWLCVVALSEIESCTSHC